MACLLLAILLRVMPTAWPTFMKLCWLLFRQLFHLQHTDTSVASGLSCHGHQERPPRHDLLSTHNG